jgi:hypothetical protein
MKHATTVFDQQRPAGRIARCLGYVGDRMFAADDADARRRGWEITVRRRGLARTYRDPRIDLLVRCPECGGDDAVPYERPACSACRGTGRILRLAEPALTGEV